MKSQMEIKQDTKKWNTTMEEKKKRNKKVNCSPWIIFIPRKLQQLQEIPTTTWQAVAMGTKHFFVGLNNTTKANGCEFRGSEWTLANKFFIGAVVHNQNRLPERHPRRF